MAQKLNFSLWSYPLIFVSSWGSPPHYRQTQRKLGHLFFSRIRGMGATLANGVAALILWYYTIPLPLLLAAFCVVPIG